MIHLVLREPLAYQRTLCRALNDAFSGEFTAWFGEPPGPNAHQSCRDFNYRFLSEVGYVRLFRELARDRQAAVILGGWSNAMARRTLLMAIILRRPIFVWTDHPHPRTRTRTFHFLRNSYLRSLARVVSGFLGCGRPTVRHLEEMGIPARKITNFPYWVEVPAEWSPPAGCSETSNVPPLRLLAVGRLIPVKQFNVAIEAVAQVNRRVTGSVQLVFVGDGPEGERLEALTGRLGCKDAVQFKGWLANEAVRSEIDGADALVLTSSFDAYGVVVLEAMSHGRPVLASDGVMSAVDRNEGRAVFFHERGNAQALANQIQELARDRELLGRAANDARAAAEKWRPSRAGMIIAELLKAQSPGVEPALTNEPAAPRSISSTTPRITSG